MEITREFVGDKEKAFEIIVHGLISDVENETGIEPEIDDIHEGYTYIKKLTNRFGNEGEVRVTIKELDPPNYYEAHFLSEQGLNILSYKLNEKSDTSFNLIYKETYEGSKTSYNLNFKIMSFLFKRSSKKRIKIMLDQLQELLTNP